MPIRVLEVGWGIICAARNKRREQKKREQKGKWNGTCFALAPGDASQRRTRSCRSSTCQSHWYNLQNGWGMSSCRMSLLTDGKAGRRWPEGPSNHRPNSPDRILLTLAKLRIGTTCKMGGEWAAAGCPCLQMGKLEGSDRKVLQTVGLIAQMKYYFVCTLSVGCGRQSEVWMCTILRVRTDSPLCGMCYVSITLCKLQLTTFISSIQSSFLLFISGITYGKFVTPAYGSRVTIRIDIYSFTPCGQEHAGMYTATTANSI